MQSKEAQNQPSSTDRLKQELSQPIARQQRTRQSVGISIKPLVPRTNYHRRIQTIGWSYKKIKVRKHSSWPKRRWNHLGGRCNTCTSADELVNKLSSSKDIDIRQNLDSQPSWLNGESGQLTSIRLELPSQFERGGHSMTMISIMTRRLCPNSLVPWRGIRRQHRTRNSSRIAMNSLIPWSINLSVRVPV